MRAGRGTVGLSAGVVGAVVFVAVLMLLPSPILGRTAGHLTTAGAAKSGTLHEVGRAVPYEPYGQAGISGGLAGANTLAGGEPSTLVPTTGAGPSQGPQSTTSSSITPFVVPHHTSPQLLSEFAGTTVGMAGGSVPPDTQVADAGSYIFEVTNGLGRVTSMNGSTVYTHFTLQGFFATGSTDTVRDVQVFYDSMTSRWFVSADDVTTNYFHLAVSKTASPLGAYWQYRLSVSVGAGAQVMDQPEFGMSKTLFAVDTNQYNSTTSAYLGSIVTVLNKHKLETGNFSFQLLTTSELSLHPARQITNNGSGTDVLYLASTVSASSSTSLAIWAVSGSIGSLAVHSVIYAIASTGTVPLAVQAGNATPVVTGDDRVQSASWANGILWVSFAAACTPSGDGTTRSCVRVDAVLTGTNTLLQDTNTAVAGEYLYYGALTSVPTGAGYLMILSYSGALSYPSVAMTGQNTTDPYGTFRGPIPALVGSSYDTTYGFGDYSGIQLGFGGTKTTAWGAAEYTSATGGWATELVHFSFF